VIDLEQERQYGEIAIQYRDPSQWTPGADTGPADVLEEFIQSLEQDGGADD
jgi:hypothetical protein